MSSGLTTDEGVRMLGSEGGVAGSMWVGAETEGAEELTAGLERSPMMHNGLLGAAEMVTGGDIPGSSSFWKAREKSSSSLISCPPPASNEVVPWSGK